MSSDSTHFMGGLRRYHVAGNFGMNYGCEDIVTGFTGSSSRGLINTGRKQF